MRGVGNKAWEVPHLFPHWHWTTCQRDSGFTQEQRYLGKAYVRIPTVCPMLNAITHVLWQEKIFGRSRSEIRYYKSRAYVRDQVIRNEIEDDVNGPKNCIRLLKTSLRFFATILSESFSVQRINVLTLFCKLPWVSIVSIGHRFFTNTFCQWITFSIIYSYHELQSSYIWHSDSSLNWHIEHTEHPAIRPEQEDLLSARLVLWRMLTDYPIESRSINLELRNSFRDTQCPYIPRIFWYYRTYISQFLIHFQKRYYRERVRISAQAITTKTISVFTDRRSSSQSPCLLPGLFSVHYRALQDRKASAGDEKD